MKIVILCLGLIFGSGCGSSTPSPSPEPSEEKDASAPMCPPNNECVRWWADPEIDSCQSSDSAMESSERSNRSELCCLAELAHEGVSCGDGGVCDGEGHCGTK